LKYGNQKTTTDMSSFSILTHSLVALLVAFYTTGSIGLLVKIYLNDIVLMVVCVKTVFATGIWRIERVAAVTL
jgi:hypothetical protein